MLLNNHRLTMIYVYIYESVLNGKEGLCAEIWNRNWIIILVKDTVGYTCYIHTFPIFNTLECTIKKQPSSGTWYAGCYYYMYHHLYILFYSSKSFRCNVLFYYQLPRFLVSLANKFLQICVLFSYSFPSTFYFSLTSFLILSSLSR